MANEMLDFVFSNMLLAADAGILNETSNASVNGISLISMLNTVSPTLLEYLFFFLAFLIFLTAFIVFVPLYIDQNWANKTNVTLMAKGRIDSIKDSHFSEDTKKELIEKIIDAAQGTTRCCRNDPAHACGFYPSRNWDYGFHNRAHLGSN